MGSNQFRVPNFFRIIMFSMVFPMFFHCTAHINPQAKLANKMSKVKTLVILKTVESVCSPNTILNHIKPGLFKAPISSGEHNVPSRDNF